MGIKYFSLSFLSLFHPVPKKAVFAALQAEYTLDCFIWCRYRSFLFSTKQDVEKRTNSPHIYLYIPQPWWDPRVSHKNKRRLPLSCLLLSYPS